MIRRFGRTAGSDLFTDAEPPPRKAFRGGGSHCIQPISRRTATVPETRMPSGPLPGAQPPPFPGGNAGAYRKEKNSIARLFAALIWAGDWNL